MSWWSWIIGDAPTSVPQPEGAASIDSLQRLYAQAGESTQALDDARKRLTRANRTLAAALTERARARAAVERTVVDADAARAALAHAVGVRVPGRNGRKPSNESIRSRTERFVASMPLDTTFSNEDASRAVGTDKARNTLSKLVHRGFLVRVGRGTYRRPAPVIDDGTR